MHDGARSPASPSPALREVLTDARTAGFLGPGPIERQFRHAQGFVRVARRLAVSGRPAPRIVDLGSGGGLPGLVIAEAWPAAHVVLLEANRRRAAFLATAVRRLTLEARVELLEARAEIAGRQDGQRGTYDGVVARSFGSPAVVAECAAPLLQTGGWLLVSEPPDPTHSAGREAGADGGPSGTQAGAEVDDENEGGRVDSRRGQGSGERWPRNGLSLLNLDPVESVHEEFEYQVLRLTLPCPDRFPRRDGVPAKRPLF
jgi:16S rRNA (guanine527-N7)-methyltransferase